MRRVLVTYRVKPDHAAENATLVQAVYEELAAAQPGGFRYATFRLADGVTFVHLAFLERDGGGPLGQIAAFARFSEGIAARCDEPPQLSEMEEVGSYRWHSD